MPRYFAQLDKNKIVQRVIVADSLEWCVEALGGVWIETFIDDDTKNYAGRGYSYHEDKGNFSSPKPFESWTLNQELKWEAPVQLPKGATFDDVKWEETTQTWVDRDVFLSDAALSSTAIE